MDSHRDWHNVSLATTAQVGVVQPLARLHKGARGIVSEVLESSATVGDAHGSTLARRLLELGFFPGEPFEVIGEVLPGGDPMAVRIGSSMFALRRREAGLVLVRLEGEGTAPLGAAIP